MPKKNSKKQSLTVLIVAFGVLIAAAISATFIIGDVSFSGGESNGYKNITFTDAVLACEKETKDKFGKRIKSLVLDNHSTRYDERTFQYKIFQNIDLKTKKPNQPALHYVNCFVRAANGRIVKYESFEHKDEKTTVIRSEETNMFGFPKKN